MKHDRFIVRRPSPSETIGGGEIIDPNPPRHKRFRPETLAALETLAAGDPDDIVLQLLEQAPIEVRELRSQSAGLTAAQVDYALTQLMDEGDVVMLGGRRELPEPAAFVVGITHWHTLKSRITEAVAQFHATQPLRPGIAREEARSRLGITRPRLFDDLVTSAAAEGALIDDGPTLRLPGFQITLDAARRARADAWLTAMEAAPFAPPGPQDHGLDAETLAALEHLRDVFKVADGVYFRPAAWHQIVETTLEIIDCSGTMTLPQFRDHFGTSRKYAQAALEQMDRLRYTRRIGDDRVRGARVPNME